MPVPPGVVTLTVTGPGAPAGVTAVIWLVAMGEGVSYQAQQQIKDLGATSIIVRSIKPAEESSRSDSNARMGISYGLLREDYERIVTNVPTIGRAVPMREISREVRHREQFIDGMVIACTPEYFGMNRLSIARGRAMSSRSVVMSIRSPAQSSWTLAALTRATASSTTSPTASAPW